MEKKFRKSAVKRVVMGFETFHLGASNLELDMGMKVK